MTLDEFIQLSLQEDIGDGDHSSLACIPKEAQGKAKLLVKEEGVLAGLEIAKAIFRKADENLIIEQLLNDGDSVKPDDIAFYVSGSSQSILKTERLVLNIMQRMSGIADITRKMTAELEGLNTRILDTRKTTPLLRFLEKEAVKIGGGVNHRMGLYDMIMLKDNHLDYAGGVKQAIEKTHLYLQSTGKNLKIEVEARDLNELEEILAVGKIDRIMLDNFSFDDLRTAVKRISGKYETEASGGITIKTLRQYGECGVDYISVGALTHSVKSLDLSLKAC
ncbi:MAG: carboxylating nicotinate-nucleotide diphosphorylase [Flavobacteriales bacterium]